MSLTLAQATEIASGQLRSIGCDDVEIHKAEEFDVGWVLYYQSVRYLETGNTSDALAGNAPLFVARSDG